MVSPVLEIGSGIGNISHHLLAKLTSVSLSDPEPVCRERLSSRFQGNLSLNAILDFNVEQDDIHDKLSGKNNEYQTLVAINVLEHIENDQAAISNMLRCLPSQGCLILLVPAYPGLFGSLDKAMQHYRRYTPNQLKALFDEHDGRLIHLTYFNALGILGWWLFAKCFKFKHIPSWQIRQFEYMMPVVKGLDKLLHHWMGLSLIAVFQKD